MKIVGEHTLVSCGHYAESPSWRKVRTTLHKAIRGLHDAGAAGEVIGVTPIKNGLMVELKSQGWIIEAKAKNKIGR